ncbi:hypothetical protein AURDEDRAFT_175300 [Auricularia subglabra TFB-10046 SS5]|uniref:C2H2-type domain-containing protein n=1 Tax=Auricularia subglabra (strain TFB-10046 / SS5) TaxID=717982 RepID=J0WTK0_AURST|nr:hypothetical protein AURDEDRAFT_175300 [Auricularia subglabra TFB-10046 SS5]
MPASDSPTVTLPPFRELVRDIDNYAGNAQRRGPLPPVPPPTAAPSRPQQRTTSPPAPPSAPAGGAAPIATSSLQVSREDWRGMTQLSVSKGPDGKWHCPALGCTHSYTIHGNLQTHYKRNHTGGKPYNCKFGCEARFASEDELAEHIKIHPATPDWPFTSSRAECKAV